MKDLAAFLLASANSGIYAAPALTDALKQSVTACGLAWFDLDLAGVADKPAFLERCQKVFSLLPAFGRNWDALADSIQDMSWRPACGYVVFCHGGGEFARRMPQDCATALEIFAAATEYWRTQNKLFMVLLDQDTGGSRKLQPLPAY